MDLAWKRMKINNQMLLRQLSKNQKGAKSRDKILGENFDAFSQQQNEVMLTCFQPGNTQILISK